MRTNPLMFQLWGSISLSELIRFHFHVLRLENVDIRLNLELTSHQADSLSRGENLSSHWSVTRINTGIISRLFLSSNREQEDNQETDLDLDNFIHPLFILLGGSLKEIEAPCHTQHCYTHIEDQERRDTKVPDKHIKIENQIQYIIHIYTQEIYMHTFKIYM